MRYLEQQGVWLLDPPVGESYEVIVTGNPSAPHSSRLALVLSATQLLHGLRDQAVAYLDAFVERGRFAQSDEWHFESIESGRVQSETESQFSFYFSLESDLYGEWSVTFQASGGKYFPVAFCRRQT